jgi:hypothetical protein
LPHPEHPEDVDESLHEFLQDEAQLSHSVDFALPEHDWEQEPIHDELQPLSQPFMAEPTQELLHELPHPL